MIDLCACLHESHTGKCGGCTTCASRGRHKPAPEDGRGLDGHRFIDCDCPRRAAGLEVA